MEGQSTTLPAKKSRKGKRPPKAFNLGKQEAMKEEIRRSFLTRTKSEIVLLLKDKFKIAKATAYKYIDKVIKEDIQDIDRQNVLSEVLASKAFRKRQLLLIWQKMIDREKESERIRDEEMRKPPEERDRSRLQIVEYSPLVKARILEQLANEDKTAISLLQELSFIEKPKDKIEIEERNYKFSIELKKLEMITPEMIEDDQRTQDSVVANAKAVGSLPDTTGQKDN